MQAGSDSDLLERATTAIERIDGTIERQDVAFSRHQREMAELFRRIEERDALAAERHEALMREHRRALDRFSRSENRVVESLAEIGAQVERGSSHLDDMGEAIRANTQAVLSMLDRLGPATG